MKSLPPTRRNLLRGLGLGTAALPLLAEGLRKPALAASSGFPTRLVIVVMPNGVYSETFWPKSSGPLSIDTGPTSSLAPLKPFEKKLMVIGGLQLKNMYDANAPWAHSSTPFVLTAAPGAPFEGAWDKMMFTGGAPSLDLHVAHQLQLQGVKSRVPSLVLRTGNYTGNDSYNSIAGAPINNKVNAPTPELDPKRLLTQLFGNLDLSADVAARTKVEDQAILNHTSKRLEILRNRLGKQNAQAIAAHWDAVNALKNRISNSSGASCSVPAAPSGYENGSTRYMGKVARAFSDLTVAALRCDLTRVSCIGWTGGSWQFTFPSNGEAAVQDGMNSGPFKDEHGIAHDVTQGASAVKQKQMVDRWFAAEFAYLLAQMDAVKEGDGTMLDHSIVVLANQMADGFWHSANDIPFLIAGGGNGKINGGRMIRYAAGSSAKNTKPHSGLLLDVCNAMDVDGAGMKSGPYGGAYGLLS